MCALWAALASAAQEGVREFGLWNGVKMPGKSAGGEKSSGERGKPNEGFQRVSTPTLRFYKADSADPVAAVIICPGGGYGHLAYGKEGTAIAEFLSGAGVSCFVLKYRIPGDRDAAFQDAQRAVRLVRKNAEKWNIDPDKVGIMGFSAGGHLSARVSTNFDAPSYEPLDAADSLSARPNFTVLIYPAYLADSRTLALSPEIRVTKGAPRAFIVQTMDDTAYEASSVGYFLALRREGVPADFHMFEKGGHGYGLNHRAMPVAAWGEMLRSWLKFNGYAR